MSATLHVRCPINGCGKTVDSVIETDTWGSTIPGDHGCGNVTLTDSAMIDHIAAAHTREDVVHTLANHYSRTVEAHTHALAVLRLNNPDMFPDE